MRQTSLNMVYELAKKDPRVVFVGSDLGVGTLKQFKQEMPQRFLMEGVSEANIIGLSAGLALEGKIVYVNTIATFLTRRCFEQVVLDLCLHNVNVRLIASGGGVVYAPLGPTHLAIEDISILRAIPNMTIVAPSDAEEMQRLMPLTLEHKGPMYIRLAKGGDPVVSDPKNGFEIGKAILMRNGKDVLLVSTGVTLKTCLDAAQLLANQNISATVLHYHTIKPLDESALLLHAANKKAVITVEENVVTGGLGSAVIETLAEKAPLGLMRFKRIGLPDQFPSKYGTQAQHLEHYGISAETAAKTALQLIG